MGWFWEHMKLHSSVHLPRVMIQTHSALCFGGGMLGSVSLGVADLLRDDVARSKGLAVFAVVLSRRCILGAPSGISAAIGS